jgi:hypothetical protein
MMKQGQFPTALTSDILRTSFGQETAMYKGKNVKAMLPNKDAKASAFTVLREAAEKSNATIKTEKAN